MNFTEWSLGAASGATAHFVAPGSVWVSAIVVRLLSFVLGGLVAVLLVGYLTGRLFAMLLIIAILATVFEQFPGREGLTVLVLWSLSAPVGVAAGAWAGSAKRAGA